ncbi:hypothetical protein V3C99_015885 [Haemonchus contortus]
MMDDDTKRLEAEAVTLRRVAFFGVAVSTVATLVCVISVPLLYNYMQHMQSVMQSEVDFCKSRSSNIWREVTRTQLEWKAVSNQLIKEFVADVEYRLKDHPAHLVLMARTEPMENQECLDETAPMHHPQHHHHNTNSALTVPMDHQDHPEHQDLKDHLATLAPLELMLTEAVAAHPVLLDLQVLPEQMELPEILVLQVRPVSSMKYPDLLAHQGHLDLPDPQDLMDNLDRMETQDKTDHLDHLETTVHPEHLDNLEAQDLMGRAVIVDQVEVATTAHLLELLPAIKFILTNTCHYHHSTVLNHFLVNGMRAIGLLFCSALHLNYLVMNVSTLIENKLFDEIRSS